MAKQGAKQASKKAQNQAKIDSIGNLGTSKSAFETSLSSIEEAIGDFIQRVKNNIQKEDMVSSGQMEDITMKTENGSINVYGNSWLIYQDKGVSGIHRKYNTPFSYSDKRPPVEVFKEYIKRKNLQLRDNAKYYGKESPFKDLTEEEKITRVGWAMSTKVYQDGLKPRNIFSKEIPQLEQDIMDLVGEAVVKEISLQIDIPDIDRVKFKL